jgi:hypothetical protein
MEDTNYTKPSHAPKIGSTQSLLGEIGKEPSPDGSYPLNWTLWLWCLEGTQLLLSIHQTLSWYYRMPIGLSLVLDLMVLLLLRCWALTWSLGNIECQLDIMALLLLKYSTLIHHSSLLKLVVWMAIRSLLSIELGIMALYLQRYLELL